MTNALITGITGQDGAYLAKFLLKKGYTVFGTYRRQSSSNFWRLHYLNIADKINFISADALDSTSLYRALEKSNPSEVYHFAAQSFVGASFDQPLYTSDVTGFGTVRMLDEILKFNNKIKTVVIQIIIFINIINGVIFNKFKDTEYFTDMKKSDKRIITYSYFQSKLQGNLFLSKLVKTNSDKTYCLYKYYCRFLYSTLVVNTI